MAVKKSQLYSSLWKSCDELRGGMDASQYKDYVLVLLFMRYVTDKYYSKPDSIVHVPEGGSFRDIVALKNKPDIGDRINKIITKFADANGLQDVFREADFNDKSKLGDDKEMQQKLSNLVSIFEKQEFNLSKNRADGDDLLGDAYEYLMKNFATESGKSKGQFYTPAEVSQIIAKVIGIKEATMSQTVYDPTCGSGSLLLRAAYETSNGISIFGQENDVATKALATMNMWLHGYPTAEIWRGNTLTSPHWIEEGKLKTFDFVIANPPFSTKSWSNGLNPKYDQFGRFQDFGDIPPEKNGDYAFLLHLIKSMKSSGKGAIILPLGVLFRGNSEGTIRMNIVERGYIKGIIGLPPNLFFGTGISACIIVMDKENAIHQRSIFMVSAEEGYAKDGNKNRLRARDIHKIVDVFNKQTEIPKYSRLVKYEEIEKNNFNLNISLYIDSSPEEEIQDIDAHLNGGIPEKDLENLNKYWTTFPELRNRLFIKNSRRGYYDIKINSEKIRDYIFESEEHAVLKHRVEESFQRWWEKNLKLLKEFDIGNNPKIVGNKLSESLLEEFKGYELIENYDVYQEFMNYWDETMQDDLYLVSSDGWKSNIEILKNQKEKVIGWECPLLPKEIVTRLYFKECEERLEKFDVDLKAVQEEMQAMEEENMGEEDLYSEVRVDEVVKISKTLLKKRRMEIKNNPSYKEEIDAINQYLILIEKESQLKMEKVIQEDILNEKLIEKYRTLSYNETRSLVIDSKWHDKLISSFVASVEQTFYRFASIIGELESRYEKPLPEITNAVRSLEEDVETHLRELGFKW